MLLCRARGSAQLLALNQATWGPGSDQPVDGPSRISWPLLVQSPLAGVIRVAIGRAGFQRMRAWVELLSYNIVIVLIQT